MLKTPDKWAEEKDTDLHELAGAKVHNDWIAGQQIDEATYDKGMAAYQALPLGTGSPQLPAEAVKRVLAQHKKNLAEQKAFKAKHAKTLQNARKLPRDKQIAALTPIRAEAAALHARHNAAIKAAARGN